MAKVTTTLSAEDRVILFCTATRIDHASGYDCVEALADG
jgi:hypothetical protein